MRCLGAPRHSLAEFSGLQILYSWGENTLHSPCSYIVVASSSSCAQVSLVSAGFTSWLTVSITIKGMIGSFKSVLKSLVSCLLLSILLGSFQSFTVTAQWNVEICCIGLFLLHGYCFFGFVTQIPCSILSDLYIWMKIYACELNVPVLSNQTGLLTGSWDCIKV